MTIPDWQLKRIKTPLVRVRFIRRGYTVTCEVLCRPCVQTWQDRQPALTRHERVDVTSVVDPAFRCDECDGPRTVAT